MPIFWPAFNENYYDRKIWLVELIFDFRGAYYLSTFLIKTYGNKKFAEGIVSNNYWWIGFVDNTDSEKLQCLGTNVALLT